MKALTTVRHLAARLLAMARAHDLDRDLDDEWQSHVEMLTEDNLRRGMTPEQARRAALLRLGSAASLKEAHRDVRGLPVIEEVLQDLRFAARLMTKDRWLSAAVIAALALGIGANTVGFTIVNGAFLRGLPFKDSNRLLVISWQHRNGRRSNASYKDVQDWRSQSRTFESIAAYMETSATLSDDRAFPDRARCTSITANTFATVRQPALLGRDFTADDEPPGAEPVVILGFDLWQSRYAGTSNVIGTELRINGRLSTIVGVMPQGMQFPENSDLWVPFIPNELQSNRNVRPLRVFGRVAAHADRPAAQAELSGIATQLIAADPDLTKNVVGVRVETFPDRHIGGAGRPMFKTVMGAVTFVLLIACANVASLLLSRSATRAREIAVRMALGATRGRLVRQLLVESLLLGAIGGSVGLVLAIAGVRWFDAEMHQSLPYWVRFTPDYIVFAYVATICIVTSMLFGLAPALHVSRTSANDVMKEGGRGTAGSPRIRRAGNAMVIAELALTIVLLVGAGSLLRSFMTLYGSDLGIDIDRLMAMRLQLRAAGDASVEARWAFIEQLERRVRVIPGVEAASVTTGVPPDDGGERLVEFERHSTPAAPVFVGTVTITPHFFDVVGVRLSRGREFSDNDGAPGAETVIVNDRFAAQFFAGQDPIGQRIRFTERQPLPGARPDAWRTIVGVTPLIKQGSSLDAYINAVVYVPYRQKSPDSVSLLVRSALPPGMVMTAVRREVQGMDAEQPVTGIETLSQKLADSRWWQRTWGTMFGGLAVIALLLSSVGLYAVMAYTVSARTQEIGVRMALGAARRQVRWLVLRRVCLQLGVGLTLGFAGAFALRRMLPAGIEGITPLDPIALIAIVLLLTLVCLVASLSPAFRATRVDPVIALRAE
jgi:putative ABC transport system permease protein